MIPLVGNVQNRLTHKVSGFLVVRGWGGAEGASRWRWGVTVEWWNVLDLILWDIGNRLVGASGEDVDYSFFRDKFCIHTISFHHSHCVLNPENTLGTNPDTYPASTAQGCQS